MLGSVGEELVVDGTSEGTTVRFHRRLTRPVTTTPAQDTTLAQDTTVAQEPALPSPSAGPASFTAWSNDHDPPVLHLQGPVDVFSVDELRRELARLSAGATAELIVDLTAVTQLTSVGIAALADAVDAGRRAGHPPVLRAPTGSPAAFVLDLVGLPRHAPPPPPERG